MKELPLGDTIDAFNKDEGDMDIVAHLGVDSKKNRKVKEEVLIVAEFIAKFKQKMKEEITTMAEEYAMKMATIQEELRTSNTYRCNFGNAKQIDKFHTGASTNHLKKILEHIPTEPTPLPLTFHMGHTLEFLLTMGHLAHTNYNSYIATP